jgi:misacylated tRNA(Ala) deacylase
MTIKLYHTDSYIKHFSAEVVAQIEDPYGIVLSHTAFFPGGGGQPADKGALSYQGQVLSVQQIKTLEGQLIHILDQGQSLPPTGSTVEGELDWEYRYQLMRTHTAMHILCGVIYRDYGASVTGGNMSPLKGRMDFEFASLKKEFVSVIEEAINQEVQNARPIFWRSISRAEAFKIPDLIRTKINLLPKHIEEVRVVEIEGLDIQADGGTHVKNTSEVGVLSITDYKSKGRENKRIYVELIE